MKEIRIGENLVLLRRGKGITQEQLADFIGVTKASVSKWETGISYPDIETLPRLAAFFDVSLDYLMGYEPELNAVQIMELHQRLKQEFATQSFEKGWEDSKEQVKKYYHCHPLLLQICILWLNHYYMALAQEQRKVLEETSDLAARIKTESNAMDVRNNALLLWATAQFLLEEPDAVIEELEKVQTENGCLQEIPSLLVRAYQMKNEQGKARSKAQRILYTDLMRFISDSALYLDLVVENESAFEETVGRVMELVKAYELEKLHPNGAAVFYYHAAVGYATMNKKKRAVSMLWNYWSALQQLILIDKMKLHGDSYFSEIDSCFEEIAASAPREEKLVKESILESMKHPALMALSDQEEFGKIYTEMENNIGSRQS